MQSRTDSHHGSSIVVCVFLVSVMLTAVMLGCATTPADAGRSPFPWNPKKSTVDNAAKTPSADEPTALAASKDSALAAVQEFLNRTQEYQLAGAQENSPTPTTSAPIPVVVRKETVSLPGLPSVGSAKLAKDASATVDTPTATANSAIAAAPAMATSPATTKPAAPVLQSLEIKIPPPPKTSAGAEPSSLPGQANLAADAMHSTESPTLERLLETLEERVEQSDDIDAEWRLRLLYLAQNRDVDARDVSSSPPEAIRRKIAGFVDATIALRAAVRQPGVGNEERAIDALSNLESMLAEAADPAITTVALCRKVTTFGVYESMPTEELLAGRSIAAIVYTELRNLRSEPADDEQFRTSLSTRLELLTQEGQSVWNASQPRITDLCRKRRSDFFLAQRVNFPANLRAGEYVLKITVEDELSGKTAESNIQLILNSTNPVVTK